MFGFGGEVKFSIMVELNNTEHLLLLSSKIQPNAKDHERIIRLIEKNQIDWKCFLSRAQDTLLAPVVFRFFSSINEVEEIVPKEVITALRNFYNVVLHNNLRLVGGFDFVLNEMEKNNIKVVALKGMDVLHNLYNDFGVRQTSDIDLLFSNSDVSKARDLFLGMNFSCQYYMPNRALDITNHPSPYKFFNQEVSIDFHKGLDKVYESAKVPIDEVLDRAYRQGLDPSGRFYSLDPNDNLIYLNLHLSEHFHSYDCNLLSFLDLVEMINRELIEWETVIQRSESWNSFQTMSEMLFLVHHFFEVEVPEEILNEVEEEKRKNLKTSFVVLLKESREELRAKHAYQGSTGFKSIAHLSLVGKLKYLFFRTFPDKLYLKSKYKQKEDSHLILWLIHIFSIVGIAIKTLFRKIVN